MSEGVSGVNETLKNKLYLLHALIVWAGAMHQIIHIYSQRSAQDITLFWVACLLASEFLALPRALGSPYWVWKFCHIVSAILIIILLVGVLLYG